MRINWEDDERPALIARLGLEESASDEDISAGMTELIASDPAPAPVTPPAGGSGDDDPDEDDEDEDDDPEREDPNEIADPTEGLDEEDTIVIDVAAFRAMRERANLTARLREDDRIKTRDDLITAAVKEGKFPRSRVKHYTARYDSDPESTAKLIARMSKGMVPIEERGIDVSEDEDAESDAYPRDWVPDVAARAAQASVEQGGGAVAVPVAVPSRRSRVQTED